MREHFNISVGKWVKNELELRDEFKRASDRNSEATGLYHNYEIRYPGDTEPIREADYVLDDRAKAIRDND